MVFLFGQDAPLRRCKIGTRAALFLWAVIFLLTPLADLFSSEQNSSEDMAALSVGATDGENAFADDIYFSLAKIQDPSSGLVIIPGGGYLPHTATQAMVSMAFLERGHLNRARLILDFYENIRIQTSSEDSPFGGFAPYYDVKNFTAVDHRVLALSTSPVSSYTISHFANACVAVAALNYRLVSGDKRFDELIRAIADFYAKNINKWGLYSDIKSPTAPASSSGRRFFLAENLAAYSALVCAASVEKLSRMEKENSIISKVMKLAGSKKNKEASALLLPTEKETAYLKDAIRLRFAVMDLFYDASGKFFRDAYPETSPAASPVREDIQVFAALVLGTKTFPYRPADVNGYFPSDIVRKFGVRGACFVATFMTQNMAGGEGGKPAASAVARRSTTTTTMDALAGYIAQNMILPPSDFSKKSDVSSALFLVRAGTYSAPVAAFFEEGGGDTPPSFAGGYDLMGTAAYLVFVVSGKNPFKTVSSAFERQSDGIIGSSVEEMSSLLKVERGEKWTADTFENDGDERFYIVERQALKNADIPCDDKGNDFFTDEKIKKEGSRSLKFKFLTRQSKDEKSFGIISRVFYPSQDFISSKNNISSVKCWVAARPATFTLGVTNLKIRLRITDENGASADSKNLNYSGRGVENTILFPSGFVAVSAARAPDYSKIKKISFILEEETQTSWDINLDNLRVE